MPRIRRHVLLLAAILFAITPSRVAASKHTPPLTQEERTDRSGHVFTEREILRHGLERFENHIYDGRDSVAIDIYFNAAIRAKERRFRRLARSPRRTLERLDCLLANFDSCMADLWMAYDGGATCSAICADCRRQGAHRQDLLSDLAARWDSLPQRSPADRARFQKEIAALHKRLQNALRKVPSEDPYQQRSNLNTMGEEANALEAAVARLPDGAAGRIAARLQSQFPVLDEWINL